MNHSKNQLPISMTKLKEKPERALVKESTLLPSIRTPKDKVKPLSCKQLTWVLSLTWTILPLTIKDSPERVREGVDLRWAGKAKKVIGKIETNHSTLLCLISLQRKFILLLLSIFFTHQSFIEVDIFPCHSDINFLF